MLAYTLKRLALALLVALAVSLIAFLLLRLSGDPAIAIAGEGARQADIDRVRKTHGFDRPVAVQYAEWVGKLLRGDLGMSTDFKTEVGALMASELQGALALGLASLGLALLVAVPVGVLGAVFKDSWVDRLCLAAAVV